MSLKFGFASAFIICSTAIGLAQVSSQRSVDQWFLHAKYYSGLKGRSAEIACAVRQLQRLGTHDIAAFKDIFKVAVGEDPRSVLMDLIAYYQGRLKEALALKAAQDAAGEIIGYLSRQPMSVEMEPAKRLVSILKTARGDKDLDYATAVELLGDLYSLKNDYVSAASAYGEVVRLREEARPFTERVLGFDSNDSKGYSERAAIRRLMSKLADAYWIAGRNQEAISVRADKRTTLGEDERIVHLERSERIIISRSPLSPQLPTCLSVLPPTLQPLLR